MGGRHTGGRPSRPTERAALDAAACPHAVICDAHGWDACRVCGARAGSVGVGCAGGSGERRAPAAGHEGLGGVHAQVGGEQAIPQGAVA